MKKISGWLVVIIFFVATLIWAVYPKPVDVDIVEIRVGHFERTIEETGKTRLRDRYIVSAPVAGRLARLSVREGDVVQAGQVIGYVWPAPPPLLDERRLQEQREQVAAAEANLARAHATLQKTALALSQAEADLRRYESLVERGFISATQFENMRSSMQQRQRERDAAEQDSLAARHQLAQLRISLKLQTVKDPLGKNPISVVAPSGGKIIKLRQQSETIVAAGANLLDVGDPKAIEVVVELLTEDAAQLKPGTTASLMNWGGSDGLKAKVRLIEPSAFTKISALGVEEQRVNVVLDIVTLPDPSLALGDHYKVDVIIPVQTADDVMLVPVGCVFPSGSRRALFVIDEGRVRLTEVELIARNGRDAWIKTNLKIGTKVVAYPPTHLKHGDRVRPSGQRS